MPKLLVPENVLVALKGRKYGEIIALIKANENLLNCVDKYGASLLQLVISYSSVEGEPAIPLIKFMLTHDKFDWTHVTEKGGNKGQTNLVNIISSRRLDILKLLQDSPHIIYCPQRLSYELALIKLKEAIVSLDEDHAEHAEASVIAVGERVVKKHQEIVVFLRDATILHAIATDSTKIMDELQKAGAKPTEQLGALGGNALPINRLKPTNQALSAWFKAQAAAQQLREQNAKSAPAAAPAPVALSNAKAPAATPAANNSGAAASVNFTPSGAPKVSNLSMLLSLEKQRKELTTQYHNDRAQVSLTTVSQIINVLKT